MMPFIYQVYAFVGFLWCSIMSIELHNNVAFAVMYGMTFVVVHHIYKEAQHNFYVKKHTLYFINRVI